MFREHLQLRFLNSSSLGFLKLTMASPPHFDDVSPNIFHPSPLAFSRAICLTFSISSQTQDFDFGGGFSGTHSGGAFLFSNARCNYCANCDYFHCSDVDTIGNKRSSPDYDEDEYENDPFGHKKVIDNQFFMLVLSDVRDFIF